MGESENGTSSDGARRLSAAEVEAITRRLEAGQPLDELYRELLFESSRDVELRYSAKESRGSVLARTMAVPLQRLKRFGDEPADGWLNKIIFGDNLQALKTLLEMKERGELNNADGAPGVRLCYIDPPFATRREYRGSKGELAYRDKVEGTEFIEFLRKRLIFIHELLSEDGSLYLHLDTNKAHYMKAVLDELFGPEGFRTEIIWKRSSAHSDTKQGRAQHGRIHDTILFYSKGSGWVWNPVYTPYDQTHVDSYYQHVEEGTGRRFALGDLTAPGGASKGNPHYEFLGVTRYWRFKREEMERLYAAGEVVQAKPGAVPRQKRYLDEQPGVSLQDIWTDIKPIGAQATERTGFPTQKPVALIERVLRSSSNEGDLVLDCFAGSGTTAEVAERLGRRWVTIDCGRLAIYTAQGRLLSMTHGKGKQQTLLEPRPFELCHAGLYDNEVLEALDFDEFARFALQLFECRPKKHTIEGIRMLGTRKGRPVHLFPYEETTADMGLEYVDDLNARLRSKVRGEVFVIVPQSRCDPGLFETIVNRGGATYFILQVPYSAIEELHARRFERLEQPASEKDVNDALESYGFDFIQPPEVTASYRKTKTGLSVTIKEFRRGGLDPEEFGEMEEEGRGDLACVMVDDNFNGKDFRITDHLFADELAAAGWSFEVPASGEEVCIIYCDTHGNELRLVRELGQPAAKAKAGRQAKTKTSAKKARAKAAR